MKRLIWTYQENKPRENQKFIKANITIRVDLEMIAQFLFDKSDNVTDDPFDWEIWTPSQILKRIKGQIKYNGTDSLVIDDSDCEDAYQWCLQPDFCQAWFIDQAIELFPELNPTKGN